MVLSANCPTKKLPTQVYRVLKDTKKKFTILFLFEKENYKLEPTICHFC